MYTDNSKSVTASQVGSKTWNECFLEMVQGLSLRKGRDGNHKGKCPVHGGKSGTSFSTKIGYSGKILLHCWNDCTYRAIYEQLAGDGWLPLKNFETPEIVKQITTAVNALNWIGRGRASERSVLQAHIDIARNCGDDTFYASERDVAVRAKVSRRTVRPAEKWLERDGWLERVESATNNGIPALWRLRLPDAYSEKETKTTAIKTAHTNSPLREELRMGIHDRSCFSMSHAELFRNGRGLGKTCGKVYGAILPGPITSADLAKVLGYGDKRSVQIQIKRLAAHSMVVTIGFARVGLRGENAPLWWFGPKSEFDVAAELGLLGETQRQHDGYVEERIDYQRRCKFREQQAQWLPDGSAVDLATGEALINADGTRIRTIPTSEAPSGYVAAGLHDGDVFAHFLMRIGGREIEQDGKNIIIPSKNSLDSGGRPNSNKQAQQLHMEADELGKERDWLDREWRLDREEIKDERRRKQEAIALFRKSA